MKLFEINQAIDEILAGAINEETGELEVTDELFTELESLNEEKEAIIEYLVKLAKETEYNVKVCKEAKKDMAEKQAKYENKHARLVSIIDRECAGQKKDYGFAKVNYRKTNAVVIDDEQACLNALFTGGFDNAIKKEISIKKTELKELLKAGTEIDGAHIQDSVSCSVK